MANEEVFGAKFEIDATDLKAGITDANRYVRLAESEFKAAAAGMDDWRTSEEGLTAKMKQLTTTASAQEAKVKALTAEQARLAEEYGDTSSQAQAMQIRVNNATTAFNKSQKEIEQTEEALNQFGDEAKDAGKQIKNAGDDAEKSGGKFSKLGGAVKVGLGAIVAGAGAAIGGILGLAAASEENIEDMGKLATAFDVAGHSSETASAVFNDLVGVLGETDQAVEAANHLAKLTQSEEELAEWTDIAAGVYATFGDSLPLEGLTEAANETAKVGQVTGAFADTLNWTTVSSEALGSILGEGTDASKAFAGAIEEGASQEDAFNAALATCNDEAERAALVTQIMSAMYSEAGAVYQDVNKDLIASRQAQADLTATMAEAGKVVMPLRTMLAEFAGSLLSDALPGLQQFGEGMKAVFSGDSTAGAQQMADGISSSLDSVVGNISAKLPGMITAGVSIVNGLLSGFIRAWPSLITGIANALPALVTGLMQGVSGLIAAVTAVLPTYLNETLPGVVAAIGQMAQAFVMALPEIVAGLTGLITTLVEQLPTFLPAMLEAATALFLGIVQAIPAVLPQIIDSLIGILPTLIEALISMLPQLLEGAVQLFVAIVQAIPQVLPQIISTLIGILPSLLSTVGSMIPSLLSGAINLFRSIATAIPQVVGAVLSALGSLLSQLPGKVVGFAGQMGSAAGDMIRGMVSGIQNAAGAVWNAITNVCNNALDAVKGFFGIASPSKLMAEMFGYVGDGAVVGITKKIPALKRAMGQFNAAGQAEVNPSVNVADTANANANPGPNGSRGGARGAVTFVQNNYSPKALTPVETYRQGLKLSQTLAAGV